MDCLYHLALFAVVHCAIVSSSHSRASDMEVEMENQTNGENRPNVRNGPEFTNRVLFSDIHD